MSCPPNYNGLVPSDASHNALTVLGPSAVKHQAACTGEFQQIGANSINVANLFLNGVPIQEALPPPPVGHGLFQSSEQPARTFTSPNDVVNITDFANLGTVFRAPNVGMHYDGTQFVIDTPGIWAVTVNRIISSNSNPCALQFLWNINNLGPFELGTFSSTSASNPGNGPVFTNGFQTQFGFNAGDTVSQSILNAEPNLANYPCDIHQSLNFSFQLIAPAS